MFPEIKKVVRRAKARMNRLEKMDKKSQRKIFEIENTNAEDTKEVARWKNYLDTVKANSQMAIQFQAGVEHMIYELHIEGALSEEEFEELCEILDK